MPVRVAINGFGRIGRMFLRAAATRGLLGGDIDLAAVIDREGDAGFFAYQLRYDSAHGRFDGGLSADGDRLAVNGHSIRCIAAPADIRELPWGLCGVEYVIEATGVFTSAEQARGHLDAGAKRVIISTPAKGEGVKTLVRGINEHEYDPATHRIVSGASCTAHCLLPLLRVINESGAGIESGHVTVLLPYTASRKIVDSRSDRSWRDGRAATVNIIPSSVNAAEVIDAVYPALKGRIRDVVFRVPVASVSLVDFSFITSRDTSIEEIDRLLKDAAGGGLSGILGVTEDQAVSTDILNDARSSIYDSSLTLQHNLPDERRFFRVFAWYDNEWGYANRIVDLVLAMSALES